MNLEEGYCWNESCIFFGHARLVKMNKHGDWLCFECGYPVYKQCPDVTHAKSILSDRMVLASYYKFVVSPFTGDVTLSHNEEGHPADILTYQDLRDMHNEQDLINGYAIKQPGGWKIMNDDDQEIDDRFLLHKIESALEAA